MKGKIVGIISIKGGVGKTTTVSNLGAVLAKDFKKKVLLVDANFSAPNLGLHLGLVDPNPSLREVMHGKADVTEAIYSHELGFDVLPTALLGSRVQPFKLRSKISKLKSFYDVILIDSSPTLNEEILSTMIASDRLLVVSSPDHPTMSCTMHAIRVAMKKKTPIMGLVLNKVRNKKFEINIRDVQETTGVPVLAVLNDDIKVLEALAHTIPASTHAPKRNFAHEYRHLAATIVGETYEDSRIWQKMRKLVAGHTIPELNRKILLDLEKNEGDANEDKV